MLTLKEALPLFDFKKSTLADYLGISRQAVSNWQLGEAIPAKHELRIRSEFPQLDQTTNTELQPANEALSPTVIGMRDPIASNASNNRKIFNKSSKLKGVLYDIRGPVLEEADRLEAMGHMVTKLNIGNPGAFDLHAPEEILQDVNRNMRLAEGYSESKGLFPARKAIVQECQLNGIANINVDDIIMGNGVSELIVMGLQALLNDGDEVLIPAPDYPLWTAGTRLAGGKAIHYLCNEELGWEPSIEDIESKISLRTRAIVIINPNNPTGAVYSEKTIKKLVKVAEANDLVIFADEIYDKILYEDAVHIPVALHAKNTPVVTFNGLSKSYRLAGFRCGWMILSGDKSRADGFIEGLQMLASIRLCSNVPGQLAVQTALGGFQSIKDLVLPKGRLLEQRDLAYEMLTSIPGVSCVKPMGALYLFPKLESDIYPIENDEQLALDFLKEKHVLAVQGSAFNWPGTDHLRLIFLPRKEDLESAIEKFGDFLRKYR